MKRVKKDKVKRSKPFFRIFKKSKSEKNNYEVVFETDTESQSEAESEDGFVIEESDENVTEVEESTTDIFIPDSAIKEYAVLGLDESASLTEIKKQYRKLAKECHPDNGGDPKEFMKLQKAYRKILKLFDS